MSPKTSLVRAGAFAAAAILAGISPALSHVIVGPRFFPSTLTFDDPGPNDELALPNFTYLTNPDGRENTTFPPNGRRRSRRISPFQSAVRSPI
jgi:hypothetical protein